MYIKLKNGTLIETRTSEEVDKVVKALAKNGNSEQFSHPKGEECTVCGGRLGKYNRKFCKKCKKVGQQIRAEKYYARRGKTSVSTEQKTCGVCGKLFIVTGNTKYCSKACKKAMNIKRAKKYYAINRGRIIAERKGKHRIEVIEG